MGPLLTLLVLGVQNQVVDLDKFVYPLARPLPSPMVTVDTTDAPETAAWAAAAKRVVQDWYPNLTSWLSTQNYKSPREIRLIFKKTLEVPAYTSGSSITINGKWVTDHPNDLGMVVHELTHVVQSYPDYRGKPGWLVEGIADYTRWWRYEPEAPRSRIDPIKATYHDAYRTTAWWLAYVSDKYDRRLVPALDLAMRNKKDPMPIFQQMTGKTPDELWTEFMASRKPAPSR
jgi:hypothetical protein